MKKRNNLEKEEKNKYKKQCRNFRMKVINHEFFLNVV